MTPPAMQIAMLSSRNCAVMSARLAPSALRRPISRILSVTLVSIMFMMPMPPTRSEIPATANAIRRKDDIVLSSWSSIDWAVETWQ